MKRYIEISKSKEILGRGEIAFIFSAIHCVKRVHIRSFSGPLFPAFGLNTERYEVSVYSVRIRENTDQKNSKYGHFSRSYYIRACIAA